MDANSKWKTLLVFLSVFVAALAVSGVAEANDATFKDARDSRGALDIASIRHRYGNGVNVTHILRTYKPFSSRLLRKDDAIVFVFDTNEDSKPDQLALVTWYQGRLRALILDGKGKLHGLYNASRPDSRSVAVSFPAMVLGEKLGRYRWIAVTTYKAKKGCPKTCTDIAPNHGLILHRMWELKTLTVAVSGSGKITADRARIGCPTVCTAQVRQGTPVKLTPTPAEGWVFAGWAGGCTGTGDCVVTMDSAETVTATFVEQYSLSVSMAGPGEVIVSPPNAMCSSPGPCVNKYVAGTTVTLTVSLGMNYVFYGWSGDCAGTNPVCTLTMDRNKAVVAQTRVKPTTLNVVIESEPGAGGRVASSPAGIDCPGDCSETWSGDVIPTLVATADDNSTFAGWKPGTCYGLGAVCMVSLWPDGSDQRTATASFAFG